MHPMDHGRDIEMLIDRAEALVDGHTAETAAPVLAQLATARAQIAIAAGLHQLNMTMRSAHGVYD